MSTAQTVTSEDVKPKQLEYREENLVFLCAQSNSHYLQLLNKRPVGVELNLKLGRWRMNTEPGSNPGRPVGEGRYSGRQPYGVLGIYDRTDFQHLRNLVSAVAEITDNRQIHDFS